MNGDPAHDGAEERPTPLHPLRVVDMAEGKGELCGRILADLGAEVIRVEPPHGAASRRRSALTFATLNAGKRGVVIDLLSPQGREQLLHLLDTADIWIETEAPGTLAARGLDPVLVRARNPRLVVLSIADFGQTGPYRDWVAGDAELLAMGGVLSRSGLPGREPLLPPGDLALQATAAHAAWAALVAYWQRLQNGVGDHIDFSLYEATAQVVEPALGTVGTAQAAGYEPTRGRPQPGPYPIFPCRDGHVRVVLLAARQWQAMRAWLGEPEDLQDPALETIRGRAAAADRLHTAIGAHFADRRKHELAAEGQARGVPVAPVLTLREVLDAEHFRARGAIGRVELSPGLTADVPVGFAEIDGRRVRSGGRAPEVGEHDRALLGRRAALPRREIGGGSARGIEGCRPFEGLRVLDFGVIVFGAECARLFCELGADVIKVESRDFPDGARVSPVHFAIGHRGSKSLGVNLRRPEGIALIERLITRCDLLLSNFKPGALQKLGLGPDVLHALNPELVVVQGSALGATGPWSGWMGYGPLVRCASGLTSLWRYADDEAGFSDATVIHPDHFAARICAVTALAALIERRRSGRGSQIAISQAETILMQLAAALAAESLGANPAAPQSPSGVYPCAGEDEWCVITVRDDDGWRGLRAALGDPEWAADESLRTAAGRLAQRAAVDGALSAWTRERAPRVVAATLQRFGVPAGFMQRPDEYQQDPQLRARDFLRTFEQPGLEPRPIERAPFRSERIPAPADSPAPEPGEHTREICAELLGMDHETIETMLASGVLEEPDFSPPRSAPASSRRSHRVRA